MRWEELGSGRLPGNHWRFQVATVCGNLPGFSHTGWPGLAGGNGKSPLPAATAANRTAKRPKNRIQNETPIFEKGCGLFWGWGNPQGPPQKESIRRDGSESLFPPVTPGQPGNRTLEPSACRKPRSGSDEFALPHSKFHPFRSNGAKNISNLSRPQKGPKPIQRKVWLSTPEASDPTTHRGDASR